MKVAGIKHKDISESWLWDYLEKFEHALKFAKDETGGLDLVVGPDYGLCSMEKDEKTMEFIRYDGLLSILKREVNGISPKTVILPGTTPKRIDDKYMGLVCPVIHEGKLVRELFKETDVGEGQIAADNGLTYFRGDSSQNNLVIGGNKVAVEICSDHGKQIVDPDTFLEVIMAHDIFGGFHVGVSNDNFRRYALVCNSLRRVDSNIKTDNLVDCFEYNPSARSKIRFVEPIFDKRDFMIYDLKQL